MRLMSVSVAGAQVIGPITTHGASTEALLDGITNEIGRPVDGLLGGSFLRQFFVTIDYPNRALRLQRYLIGAPSFDEFERVGITLAASAQALGYAVDRVFPGTDAAQQGVAVGDVVVAVDGQVVAPLGPVVASELLSGPVGTLKMIMFGAAQSALLINQTVALRVDELLPE